jgi:hypothetical protein
MEARALGENEARALGGNEARAPRTPFSDEASRLRGVGVEGGKILER